MEPPTQSLDSLIFDKIAEHFVVVGLQLPLTSIDLEFKGQAPRYDVGYRGCLVDFYPSGLDVEGSYLANLPLFCFPDGIRISPKRRPETAFPFVLTDGYAHRISVTCLCFDEPISTEQLGVGEQDSTSFVMVDEGKTYIKPGDTVFVPKCICVSSSHPIYDLARDFLIGLHQKALKGLNPSIPIERYISHFVSDTPMPPGGLPVKICIPSLNDTTPTPHRFLNFVNPSHFDFPIASFPIRLLFLCLDSDNFLKLFTSVLLERRIVLCSRSNTLLSFVAEGLRTLIYPFSWPHVYIPVLPHCLLDYLQALPPFIMGVNAAYSSELAELNDVVVAYLDCNKVVLTTQDPLPLLPEKETRILMDRVRRHVHPELSDIDFVFPKEAYSQPDHPTKVSHSKDHRQPSPWHDPHHHQHHYHQRGIRVAFLRYFASLLDGFQPSLDKSTGVFDKVRFMKNRPDCHRDFLDALTDTQIFETFVAERVTKHKRHDLFDFVSNTPQSAKSIKTIPNTAPFAFALPTPEPIQIDNTTSTSTGTSRELFPRLEPSLFASPHIDDILASLDKLILENPKAPQLFVFRARLRVEYPKHYLPALEDLRVAYELDSTTVQEHFIESVLRKLSNDQLEGYRTTSAVIAVDSPTPSTFSAVSYSSLLDSKIGNILDQRKAIPSSGSLAFSSEIRAAVSRADAANQQTPTLSPHSNSGKKLGVADIIKQIELPPTGTMSRDKFIKFVRHLGLASKEDVANKLFNLLVDSERRGEIKHRKVSKFFEAISSIYATSRHWHVATLAPLESSGAISLLSENDIVLWSAKATNISGDKGQLLLTNNSLIFCSKKIGSSIVIPLVEVSVLTREGSKTTGLLALEASARLKVAYRDNRDPVYFVVWNWREREVWMCFMTEVLAANRITKELVDPRFVVTATQNVILTDAFFKTQNKFSKSLLSHWNYPSDTWCEIARKFEACGVLNMEYVWETPAREALEVVTDLLSDIIDLFYSSVLEDGETVNTSSILSNPAFNRYLTQAAELQMVDISCLNEGERTAFFINLWNVMIVHSYILVGFPTGELDFRYIIHSAYYSVGGTVFCLADIMHGVLRGNQASPWYSEPRFGTQDPRLRNVIHDFDPRVHFTLATHNKSSPSIHIVNPKNLETCMQTAAEEFCQEQVFPSLSKRKVTVPKTFDWYRSDFGEKLEDVMKWISTFLQGAKKKEMLMLLESQFSIDWVLAWHPSPKPFHSYS